MKLERVILTVAIRDPDPNNRRGYGTRSEFTTEDTPEQGYDLKASSGCVFITKGGRTVGVPMTSVLSFVPVAREPRSSDDGAKQGPPLVDADSRL